MRFRARLIVTATAVTALTLGGAFTVVASVFNRLQRTQLDEALLAVARNEATEAPANGYRFSNRPGPAANDVGPLTKYGVIYDEHGAAIAATEPFDPSPPRLADLLHPPGRCFDFTFSNEHLRGVFVPIPGNGGRQVLLATSREDLDGDEAFLFRAMMVTFAAAVAWAGAVATWMVRQQTRAQERIADVARRVAAGDLSARVAPTSTATEIDQLGRDVDDMIEQLSGLMASQERFIANAAHELQSPIAVLYGELQQALRKPRDNEGYQAAIAHATEAARRLKVLAQALLSLARARQDAEPLAPVVMGEVTTEVSRAHEASAKAKNIAFDVRVDTSMALGRRRDIERLLGNLVENAVRHAPEGGKVEIAVRQKNASIEIAVADDGPGIAAEDRPRIFEPFFRSPSARAAAPGGAGLGLAIAREIARAHGGDLRLATDVEKHRTVFVATVAAAPAENAAG
jgi:two-component system, OmpR family, sensor kinase